MSPLFWFTGGELLLYNPFDLNTHGEKLHYEIFRILTRTQAHNVEFKLRVSSGYRVKEYFGSFGYKDSIDGRVSAIDADKTINVWVEALNSGQAEAEKTGGLFFA